ncbi:hypothetical protein HPB48_005812 [Haemaphysalis longicornis]|uniref:Endonuclease/exonuclease/phosphatase domain-containing protein n=1 Tax=Haemaphysalis longicornis TaxID=44386 RepID=A0A9J6GPI4_HAELO|nr:hypothetical protein HPB48_005812 [Haemaphysalis longicornis]
MQSAVNKADQLTQFLESCTNTFDAIFLTETWYRHDNDVLKIPGYDSFDINRTSKRGGGVAILVKTKYSADVLSNHCFCKDDIEMLTVKMARQAFSVIYRPPHGNLASFFGTFERELFFFTSEKVSSFIVGDFNIDMSATCSAQQQLSLLLQSTGFQNVIDSPTRITPTCSSVLDLIVTNREYSFCSGRIAVDISDHLPVFFFFCVCVSRKSNSFENKNQGSTAINFSRSA